jgi:hypothetical protein
VHVANETGQTKDVTTLGHARCSRFSEADRTRGGLRYRRSDYLQDIAPIEVNIRILSLDVVVAARIDNEAIIGVNISVTGAEFRQHWRAFSSM